jgi:hypothetical protein
MRQVEIPKQEQLLLQKKPPDYCTQKTVADCTICSLASYNRDCMNNPIK